ncbi:hypothetical protein KC339_g17767 [Hortaea werneckii]|nr:hypothetical protein KC339_g17767 [Hortaea werneckii]
MSGKPVDANSDRAQNFAVSLGPPSHLDAPNSEATAEQYEAQRMVNDTSYEQQWAQLQQLPDAMLDSQLPQFGDLVERERLDWDSDLGGAMLYDGGSTN